MIALQSIENDRARCLEFSSALKETEPNPILKLFKNFQSYLVREYYQDIHFYLNFKVSYFTHIKIYRVKLKYLEFVVYKMFSGFLNSQLQLIVFLYKGSALVDQLRIVILIKFSSVSLLRNYLFWYLIKRKLHFTNKLF